MRKFKLFIDYDKEEKWLNEMAKKGYELENVSFGYKFRSIKPETVTFRIDYRTFKKKEDFIDYCILFKDSGWEHIVGSKQSGLQYFKRINETSEGDIFSDAISKAGKYKRLSDMLIVLVAPCLVISAALIFGAQINVNSILNPKLLYLTPGLWERTGVAFWGGFLFETPFAILRGSIWLMPLLVVVYVYLSIRARILYIKYKNSNLKL